MDSAVAACFDQVRTQDHDRYLTLLWAPAAAQPGLAALYACHLELATIPEKVSEPILGEIRYQWWRETLAEAADGKPRQHPVLQAMSPVLQAHPGLLALIDASLDARINALDPEAPRTATALAALGEGIGGAIQAAAFAILGGQGSDEAARAAGTVAFLVGVLRSLQNESGGSSFNPAAQKALNDLAAAIHSVATSRLAPIKSLPKVGRSAALLAVLAQDRLRRFAAPGKTLATADFHAGELARQLRLAWTALSGRL
jgi:NADH dehydrogenase [ubiquinone] 1 alpha subcomplex assembly factor 6